jgi:hypothetical protein
VIAAMFLLTFVLMQVRCSKERPTCRRCRLASAICTYPPPPNRKLLGAQRAQNAKAHTYPESKGSNMQGRGSTSDNTWGHLTSQEAAIPPTDVALFIIEIYFSHVSNAALMFHKPTFNSDYVNNKVPDFLSLSIFALASMYKPSRFISANTEIFQFPTTNVPATPLGREQCCPGYPAITSDILQQPCTRMGNRCKSTGLSAG